jgi:quercetin dioxygenase-like cupin family protein
MEMQIINLKDVPVDVKENTHGFFGGKVYGQFIINEKQGAKVAHLGLVKFAPGARNKFHSHKNEEIMVIVEGKGIVATKEKEYVCTPGMIVFLPPGLVHWHGATKDSTFAHYVVVCQPNDMKMEE